MTETIVETIEEELERFRDKLAEGVAIGTEMSAPAYLFSMMGPIVTINRRLMKYAMEKLQPEDPQVFKGTYNDIYFKRIAEIKSFPPGQEYYRKHYLWQEPDREREREWFRQLRKDDVEPIVEAVRKKIMGFARKDLSLPLRAKRRSSVSAKKDQLSPQQQENRPRESSKLVYLADYRHRD